GALCNISIVGHAYGGVQEDFSIWMEDGALFLRAGKLYRQGTGGKPEQVDESELPKGGNKDAAFIELIRGERTENPIGVENGLRVIQLTEAAWQSAELGKPVKVDLS
ncbi:MAG: Gfo/Idh/MocA family oxidoreductase, partial [Candidatus Poribacteria bacterium]|nr:Gfo/Idh/MocA family oxidoreductase [Candidatus Poribacteria bacterium]